MIYERDLKQLAKYANGIYTMGTDMRCQERPMCYVVIIKHNGRHYRGDNWVRMHDNMGLWGDDLGIIQIRRQAVSFRETGNWEGLYMIEALFPKEVGPCQHWAI